MVVLDLVWTTGPGNSSAVRNGEEAFKGPYADHILIPQGSTGSSIFFDIK